jgi:hypothetical protein
MDDFILHSCCGDKVTNLEIEIPTFQSSSGFNNYIVIMTLQNIIVFNVISKQKYVSPTCFQLKSFAIDSWNNLIYVLTPKGTIFTWNFFGKKTNKFLFEPEVSSIGFHDRHLYISSSTWIKKVNMYNKLQKCMFSKLKKIHNRLFIDPMTQRLICISTNGFECIDLNRLKETYFIDYKIKNIKQVLYKNGIFITPTDKIETNFKETVDSVRTILRNYLLNPLADIIISYTDYSDGKNASY